EPFTGLDKNARESVTEILQRLRTAGKLILASHHDLGDVSRIFDHVHFLNGELVAYGDTASTFTEANIEKTFAMKIFSGAHA
ncbi:MAG: manganese ABC transporter ATP-binding protein, partial [Chthoniobacterales bacterium]